MASPAASGATWISRPTSADDVFTPEDLSAEHLLIGRTAREFLDQEVIPATADLEAKQWSRARALVKRCGDLGLLGTDVPESFGGVDLDKAASVLVGEVMGMAASFATTFGAQTGLAIVPLTYFGTSDQKQRYLPGLVSGDLIGAYCLSESGSGSDALAARTRADRAADGSWILNGEKMWITNGGFADLFIVFAKIDGTAFSAFVVERSSPGVSTGQEEHKMGLHGSSTTPLILQDARVPAANLIGEAGKGHKIAFTVLNYGRFKLAGMCSGGAKAALHEAAAYAAAREQFARPIASFGAIRHKLAEMAIREYAVESMLYRTAGLIDRATAEGASAAAALEEFAIEASILKVAGSEMVDFVVDENVQIHGGNGFVRDYPAERRYRDARVNRIFEGTNEINRLVVATRAARRLTSRPAPEDAGSSSVTTVMSLKQAAALILRLATEAYGESLPEQQEILMLTADMLIDAFAAESATLRAERCRTHALASLHADAASVVLHDAVIRSAAAARTAVAAMATGDTLTEHLATLDAMLDPPALDTIAARRRIADRVVQSRGYIFQ